MAMPGETEAGSAGKQPCRGIARRAHRDDDHGRGNERLAPTLHPIGSIDPDALKIPARRAASTLTRSPRSPVPAEPAHLSPKMLSQLVDDFRSRIKTTHRQPRFATLTPREKEILKFLAEGQSVKEIATHLNLSVKTVEAHKFNLMRKLDIHNKAQLVQYAIQKKIIKIPVGP